MASGSRLLNELQGSIDDDFWDDGFDPVVEPEAHWETRTPKARVLPASVACEPGRCSICLEDSAALELVRAGSTCRHEFCRECLGAYAAARIREAAVASQEVGRPSWRGDVLELDVVTCAGVRCPGFGCRSVIDESQIRQLVDESTYGKLIQFLFDNLLVRPDGLRSMLTACPRGCGGWLQENCECSNVDCRLASRRFAMIRDTRDQTRETRKNAIAEIARRREELRGKFKCCPSCRAAIEKNGGCDHMHCMRCDLHFNWSKAPSYERAYSSGSEIRLVERSEIQKLREELQERLRDQRKQAQRRIIRQAQL